MGERPVTIGIGAFGPMAGAAVIAAWAEAERRAAGDLHGFAVFTILDNAGVPVSLECQRGGFATIRGNREALARMARATVAGVITSGPDRPEPLGQFLAAGAVGLVTGHRLPNLATADGPAANRAALDLLERGMPPGAAIERVLRANPDLDAGLIAVTETDLGMANSAHVARRADLGEALILSQDRRYGLALMHNSISPVDGLAAAAVEAGEAVLRTA